MPISIDSIIDRQLRRWELERNLARATAPTLEPHPWTQPLITVSRQHGSSGATVAARLAERFNYTLLHRDTIDRMCESTGYARRLLEALDEHSRSQVTNWFDSMLAGKWLDAGDYVRALLKTIYSIAELGGVVVVGRGANFVVGPERGFHIRIVAPRDVRIRNIVHRKDVSERDAAHEIDARDRERAEFVRKAYGGSIDDPLGYDLVINEAGRAPDAMVAWLASAAREKFGRLRPVETRTT